MLMMYSLQSTPPQSSLSSSADNGCTADIKWLSCGQYRLLSDRYRIGCHNEKNITKSQYYPISANVAQYPIAQCQYRSNPVHKTISV